MDTQLSCAEVRQTERLDHRSRWIDFWTVYDLCVGTSDRWGRDDAVVPGSVDVGVFEGRFAEDLEMGGRERALSFTARK